MQKRLWFRDKKYGYGWTPATWEGWVVIAVYLIMVYGNLFRLDALHTTDTTVVGTFVIETLIMTIAFIAVTFATGETPRWHWGDTNERRAAVAATSRRTTKKTAKPTKKTSGRKSR